MKVSKKKRETYPHFLPHHVEIRQCFSEDHCSCDCFSFDEHPVYIEKRFFFSVLFPVPIQLISPEYRIESYPDQIHRIVSLSLSLSSSSHVFVRVF